MKRLTQQNSTYYEKAIKQLQEYENTGLTPAEIEQLQKENAELKSRLEKSVELPCKVGDKIYQVAPFKGKEILIHTVTGFIVAKTVNKILTKVQLVKVMPSSLEPLLIGINLFLTKEEAEQALKGGAKLAESEDKNNE